MKKATALRLVALLTPCVAVGVVVIAALPLATPPVSPPRVTTRTMRVQVSSAENQHGIGYAEVFEIAAPSSIYLGSTDVTGTATVRLADGPTTLEVRKAGLATAQIAIAARGKAPGFHVTETDAYVTLFEGAPVRGRVLDADTCSPIAGAIVESAIQGDFAETSSRSGTASTVADGRFELWGVQRHPGWFGYVYYLDVRARMRGFVPGVARVPPIEGDAAVVDDILLERAAVVRGRVLHPDGTSAAGVGVRFGDADEVVTDAGGEFVLDGIRRETRYVLEAATADGAEATSVRRILVPRGAAAGRADMQLERRGVLRVRIVGPDGVELPSDRIRATLQSADDPSLPPLESRHPVVFRELRPGKWRVHASVRRGAWSESVVDVAAGVQETAIRVGGTSEISGRLVDDRDVRISEAEVSVHLHDDPSETKESLGYARSGDRGEFRIGGLPEGMYDLVVSSMDDRAARLTIDAPAHDLIVRMDRDAVITGTVRVPPGVAAPADGSCRAENAAASSVCNRGLRVEDGRFRIQVAPRGHWKLSLDWEGFSTTPVECDVAPGETTDVGEVTLTPMAGVTGRVVDEDGIGVPNAYVSFPKIAGTRADSSGSFRLRREAPGRVVVEAFTETLRGALVLEADAPRAGVKLIVHPIRRIEVLVEDRIDGLPRVQRVVLVRSSDGVEFDKCGTDTRDRAHLNAVAGEWVVRALDVENRPVAEATVRVPLADPERPVVLDAR